MDWQNRHENPLSGVKIGKEKRLGRTSCHLYIFCRLLWRRKEQRQENPARERDRKFLDRQERFGKTRRLF